MRAPGRITLSSVSPLDRQEQLTRIEALLTEIALKRQTMAYARVRVIISILVAAGAVLSGAAAVEALFHRPPPAPIFIFLNAPPANVI
jgi:hypothetical protein